MTGLQLNWTNVEFVPPSPAAAIPISRVTSVSFAQGGELIEFAGDNNRYPSVIVNNINRPRAAVTSGDVATLASIGPGTTGTLNATQVDALGVTGGSVVWTMAGAVSAGSEDSGHWGRFASATLIVRAYAADGATNPLSFTRA